MTGSWLDRWTAFIVRQPQLTLSVLAAFTLLAAWIAVSQFSMNSDTSRLIRQDTEWRRHHDALVTAFPQYDKNSFVVVSGHQPAAVLATARELAAELRASPAFRRVYLPADDPFVDQHALLFLETDELGRTISRLADAQPLLTAVVEDGLRGVYRLMIEALTSDETLPAGFDQIAATLDRAARQAMAAQDADSPAPLSWRDELFQDSPDKTHYQVIYVQGRQDFGRDLPNQEIMEALRGTLQTFIPRYPDVSIRLTGIVPLEHSEIESALDSARLAGTLALVLLIAVLTWGVRSLRMIVATYLAMICGLIWTAAFAMLVVGQFNTISIIFLVIFIGLGVDFAIHLCLKYQESRQHLDRHSALVDASRELGPAIVLCGVTTAIGFLSFVPTDYVGLAEMGLISAGGMIIAVVVSLTLIPAFFALNGDLPAPNRLPMSGYLLQLVDQHHRKTAWGTLALGAVLAVIATGASFDYGTLSLKDPESEAMTTLAELQEQQIVTDYALLLLARDEEEALSLKSQLQSLKEVGDVRVPLDYLPDNQDEKLAMLEDASFLMDTTFYAERDPSAPAFTDSEHLALLETLASAAAQQDTPALQQLAQTLSALMEQDARTREQLEIMTVPSLEAEIRWLRGALAAGPVTLDNLPDALRSQLTNDRGEQVVTITPAEDVVPVEAMRRFTEAVRAQAPAVVGRPVLDLGIGDIVVQAFFTAIALAVSGIFCVLLLSLGSLRDSVLVFIPLVMTALFTLSVSVVANLPLNMANVIVIPLIFGLGVDNGVHVVKRFRQSRHVAELATSSTPRAVFLSNLTTIGTFAALITASHLGIASIGILLTVALICLMILTLVSLPALLATFSDSAGRDLQST